MRIKSYRTLIVLLALIAIFSFNYSLFAGESLPKKIKKEKEAFLENQISPANKLFLNQLGLNLQHLSEINGYTLEILNFLPSVNELTYSKFIKAFQAKAKRIIPKLTGRKKSGQNVKCFIKEYFGKESDLKSNFEQLLTSYSEIKKLEPAFSDNFTEDLLTAGVYRYYTLCSNSLDDSPSEILKQIVVAYDDLAKVAKKHKIEKLKQLLPEKILFLEESYNALENKLVSRLEHTLSGWGYNMILQILNLVQQQIIFDKNFSENLLNTVTPIPIPNDPRLPDLKVISIGMASADTVKIDDKITLVVAIKNVGQLSTCSSKAKIIFPNGKVKTIDVPKLNGGQAYLKTLKWKIDRVGENEFTVTANTSSKAWESNISNNVTKRVFILQ